MRKPVRWIERLPVKALDQSDWALCEQIGFEKYLAFHRGEQVFVGEGVRVAPLVRCPGWLEVWSLKL